MSRTKTGLDSIVGQRTSGYKKQTGYWENLVKDFTDEASAQAYGYSLVPDGYEWKCSPIGAGCWRIEATGENSTDGGGGSNNDPNLPLNDFWELQPNMVEKELMDVDSTAINAISKENRAIFKNAIQSITPESATPAFTGSGAAAAQKLFLLAIAGVKSARIFAPVIKHTKLVKRNYSVSSSLTNVGSVILVASFQTTENVPGILLFNLPTNSDPTRDDGLVLKYGWLKKYPTISQVAGGKWQIVQEWEYGLWSTDLYVTV